MDHDAIRRTLAYLAGDSPDASAIAEATEGTWQRVASRLSPVIGTRGVDALFNRARHVTSKTFPWLATTGNDGGCAEQMANLKAHLAGREPNVAAEASYVLLVTFTVLLATLIGEPLTERLLESIWIISSQKSEHESKP
jgi:hypothetical protein